MRALITGATGLLGRHLLARLDGDAVALSRDPARARARLAGRVAALHAWLPEAGPPPAEAFEGVDVVVHLAGAPVGERWTARRKRRIRESRVAGTRHLVQALGACPRPPPVLISASAVGYYGDRGDEILDEAAPPGRDFLADVCREWEAEALRARFLGLRVVTIRTGIVLAPDGGALPRMLPPFRLGLGGPLGDGRAWMPWVHVDDVIGMTLHAARTPALDGPLNAVGPDPVRNADFTRALARVLRRPAIFPVPRAALSLLFGEMSGILLASQRALPRAAERAGYAFAHGDLETALRVCV
jgi:hypothetical protein